MTSRKDHLFLGVFDGHGGKASACFTEANLISTIESTSEWKAYVEAGCTDPVQLGHALEQAFLELDRKLRTHLRGLGDNTDVSGCTASTCMITPTHFVCANAGDSRTVLGVSGRVVPLSSDHKPSDDEECRRIINAGGSVQW